MKTPFIIGLLLSYSLLWGDNPGIQINGTIIEELRLRAEVTLDVPAEVDTLAIYLLSAGADETHQPILNIHSIQGDKKKIQWQQDSLWIHLKDVSRFSTISIHYELDLKEIPDWRKSFGYASFPSTYEDKCWYPDIYLNGKRDFHKDFHITLQHPKSLAVLTSGQLITEENHQQYHTSHFLAKNVRYCALNTGLNFVRKDIKKGATTFSLFCSKELEQQYLEVIDIAIAAVDWYRQTYGFFPTTQLGIAMGHPRWHGGFPSENLFYIHRGNLKKQFLQWITAHEIGHYYWGLHTLSANEDELSPILLANGIWIDHLYLAEVYQKPFDEIWHTSASQAAMIEKYLATCLANFNQRIGFTLKDYNKFSFDYNSNIAHGKAAVGLYLLSNLIGPEQFVELQKEILKTYAGQPFSINNFTDFLMDKGYSYSQKFIEQWYHDHASIEYNLYRLKLEEQDKTWHYSFEVRKKGTVDYPIDITVTDIAGKHYTHRTKANSSKEVITGIAENKPVKFDLDLEGKVPMWNSDNSAIQRNYIFALFRAGKTKAARILAEAFVREHPDDERIDELKKRLKR